MTTQWELMRELASMQDRMNRVWGTIEQRREDLSGHGAWLLAVDIYETADKQFVLKAELPGLRREDIDVTVENNTLTIRAERKPDEGTENAEYHRSERMFGTCSRSFTLPNTVDAGRVKADYRDGVLTVRLPRREEARPRQITVDVNG